MDALKVAPWVLLGGMLCGFLIGRQGQEKAEPRSVTKPYFTAYIQRDMIAVLNTRNGDMYLFGPPTKQWVKLPPLLSGTTFTDSPSPAAWGAIPLDELHPQAKAAPTASAGAR